MSAYTAAYLGSLLTWAVAATAAQGVVFVLGWRLWRRLSHRLALVTFCLWVGLPFLTMGLAHLSLLGMGPEIARTKPTSPVSAGIDQGLALPATLFAGVWIAGVVIMLILLSWQGLRVALTRTRRPCPDLEHAVRGLIGSGASAVRVRIAEVRVPQAVGLRRPTLWLPADFGTALPADERDAVLLHELAHVERADFGWNLVQRVGLALAWYQPAAWLAYRVLAETREERCDALAVARGAQPGALARALIRFALEAERPRAAMSIQGADRLPLNGVSRRVRALVGHNPVARDRPAGVNLACGLTAALAITTCFGVSRVSAQQALLEDLYIASAFGPTVVIRAQDAAGRFTLRVRRGEVVEASIADRRLDSEEILQAGSQVRLLESSRDADLLLTVTAHGRIFWDARPRQRAARGD